MTVYLELTVIAQPVVSPSYYGWLSINSGAETASISVTAQQYRVLMPTVGNSARIFTQPSRNAYLGRIIPQCTKITSIGEQQEFVKIRLADNTSGWVFNDQVNPCTNL